MMNFWSMMITNVFLRVLVVSLGCSAVLLPLLLSVSHIQKRVAADSFYILFLLLAVRLVVPVSFSLPEPVVVLPELAGMVNGTELDASGQDQGNVAGDLVLDLAGKTQTVQQTNVDVETGQKHSGLKAHNEDVISVLALLWAVGAAACMILAIGSYLSIRRKIFKVSLPAQNWETDLMKWLCGELRLKHTVRMYHSIRVASPMALGLFRPVILLPVQTCRQKICDQRTCGQEMDSAQWELEFILRHELTHIRRRDVAYKVVLSLACAMHWFNPLVWMMSRVAGYNLEMCCDNETVQGLSGSDRKRYGKVLLDTVQSSRPMSFSTGFSNGKEQLKLRLANLFMDKRKSHALVCMVLAAAILMSGLIGYENVQGISRKRFTDRKDRKLYEDYFYKHYNEDEATVVLADLSGDGKAEMMVLTMDTMDTNMEEGFGSGSIRKEMDADSFANASIDFYYVKNNKVVQFPGTAGVANAHAGWGYCYLVPYSKGGYALLDFRAYTDATGASCTYELCQLDLSGKMGDFITLEQGGAFYRAETASIMGPMNDTDEFYMEPEELLDRVEEYQVSGVPIVVFQDVYVFMDGKTEFSYLDVAPSEAFAGRTNMDVSALSKCVVTNGGKVIFTAPDK